LRLVNRIYSRALPLLDRASFAGLPARLRSYRRLEERSVEDNAAAQWEALQRICVHAYTTTPFYKQRFDAAGINPHRLQSPSDLSRLPLLTRSDIDTHLEDLWSRKFDRAQLSEAATGGTTTTPVKLLRNAGVVLERNAIQGRFNEWAGMFPGDKVFYLWGALQDYAQQPSLKHRLYERYVARRVWAQTTLSNDATNREQLRALDQFRPDVIYAYPTPLANLSEWIQAAGERCHRPRTIICTAEALRLEQRAVIEEVFGCKVFEHYGARDFGMIAAECEQHRGLHLHPAAAFVEFQEMGADEGEAHEIVVTDLLNLGMPMIRYQIGDCAVAATSKCTCGRGFPLVQSFLGRTTDNFYLADGSIVRGVSIPRMLAGVSRGIRQVQVIQNAVGEFEFRFVRGDTFQASDLELMRHEGRQYFGSQVQIRLEEVESIPRERSGKTRLCICKLTVEQKQQLSNAAETQRYSRSVSN
jgi:phenylacetate-CoA ligase